MSNIFKNKGKDDVADALAHQAAEMFNRERPKLPSVVSTSGGMLAKPVQSVPDLKAWVNEITMVNDKQRQLSINSVEALELGADQRKILVEATEAFFAAVESMLPVNSSLQYSIYALSPTSNGKET